MTARPTDTPPRRRGRLRAPIGVTTAVLAGLLVPATAARADEVADSDYDVYCTIHPDAGNESSTDPAGVLFDGEHNDVAASPSRHAISGSSRAVYPAGSRFGGEDCGVSTRWEDMLTVGAGSSGLAAGDQVPVQLTVRLDADLDENWDGDGAFQTRARYSAVGSIRSLDRCTVRGEPQPCDVPLSFGSFHEHNVYGGPPDPWYPNGYVEAQGERSYDLTTNAGTAVGDYVDEYRLICEAWPCAGEVHPAGEPEVFTVPATLTVGRQYQLVGDMDLFTQAYDNVGVEGLAVVDDFSLTLTPGAGYEGVALTYAAGGGGGGGPVEEDTTAPTLTAANVTVEATGPGGAAVPFSLGVSDDTDPDPAVACEPADGATFPLGTTPVSCTATDDAGNIGSAAFDVAVVDTTPPVLSLPGDFTVDVFDPKGLDANFPASATDLADPKPVVACTPPSGTLLPVGKTTVQCTATDAAGNSSAGSFTVTMLDPRAALALMRTQVEGAPLSDGATAFLLRQLDAADRALAKNDWRGARQAFDRVADYVERDRTMSSVLRNRLLLQAGRMVELVRASVLPPLVSIVRQLAGILGPGIAQTFIDRLLGGLAGGSIDVNLLAKVARDLGKELSPKGSVASQLTPAQIAEAQRLTDQLLDGLAAAKGAL